MAATAPAAQTDDAVRGDFIGLPLFAFSYPGVANVDLYGQTQAASDVQLLCDKRRGLAPNELNALTERGHHYLMVRQADYQRVATALFDNLDPIASDGKHPVAQRIMLVQAACYEPLETAFRLIGNEPFIDLAIHLGGVLSRLALEQACTPLEAYHVLSHDASHAVHATNVALYASLLAMEIGELDELQLQQIAVGAMLHDLGLRRRRSGRGKLVAWCESTEQAPSHPQVAYEAICQRSDMSRDQMLMVYQHHEQLDGTGGPVGLSADEIHPWAKILAVVNRFDSLTCDRPFRARQPIPSALASLNADAGSSLDSGVVACWTSAMQRP